MENNLIKKATSLLKDICSQAALAKIAQEFEILSISDFPDILEQMTENKSITEDEAEDLEEQSEEKKDPKESKGDTKEKKDYPKQILHLMAFLKVNSDFSQTAHWLSKGDSSYGDHLLYERLYEDNNGELDEVAEQFIPTFGEEVVNINEIFDRAAEISHSFIDFSKELDAKELATLALSLEEALLELIDKTYNCLKDCGVLSMGADDLLMELFRNHEKHVYLLGQKLK